MNRCAVLIDLSSIAYPIWMTSSSEPDPNAVSTKIVARIRNLASNQPHVAICCDKGRSFRAELAPSYKANRPPREEALHHQIDLACETLKADGFPVWAVRGFEADDVIASATTQAQAHPDTDVLIVSADKDLLQLVGDRVTAMSARDGAVVTANDVVEKFGVRPEQMRDYLTMVGDASDNVKGIAGIGPKRASELLARFDSLDRIYEELAAVGAGPMNLTVSIAKALREFQPHLETTRKLITLRTDAEIPFDELFQPRVVQEIQTPGFASEDYEMDTEQPTTETPTGDAAKEGSPAVTSIATREPEVLTPAPAEWERQLDPRSLRDAKALAFDMFNSRMFSAYGTVQGVLATVMVGRELGLPAMASLRSIHVIEGKHALSAALMVALVLRSGLAEFFEPIEISPTSVTYETHRKGGRNPIKLTHTIEMARQAWPKAKKDWEEAFNGSGWGRVPTDMLVARCTARLCRLVYPDLLAGLYTPEELAEIREQVAA